MNSLRSLGLLEFTGLTGYLSRSSTRNSSISSTGNSARVQLIILSCSVALGIPLVILPEISLKTSRSFNGNSFKGFTRSSSRNYAGNSARSPLDIHPGVVLRIPLEV